MKKFSELILEDVTANDHKFWYIPKTDEYDAWKGGSEHHVHRLMKNDKYKPYRTKEAIRRWEESGGVLKGNYDATIVGGALGEGLVRGLVIVNGLKYDQITLILSIAYDGEKYLPKLVNKLKKIFPEGKYTIDHVMIDGIRADAPGVTKPILNTYDERKIEHFLKTGRIPK